MPQPKPKPGRKPRPPASEASADGHGGARLMIRLAFGAHDAIGPGKARLMELVDRHGSISAASRAMGISYRRAWLLIEGLRRAFRKPVVAARHGGKRGGGAGLTVFGRALVRRYRAIERRARAAVARELRAMGRDMAQRPAPAPRKAPPPAD
jgi:molybdate transport system regulatory protein